MGSWDLVNVYLNEFLPDAAFVGGLGPVSVLELHGIKQGIGLIHITVTDKLTQNVLELGHIYAVYQVG